MDILIVEDDMSCANMYINFFRDTSFKHTITVNHARNAAEAIYKLSDKKYDILVLDICMPRKSGTYVTRYIQENNINIKIIIVSGIPLICQPEYYDLKKISCQYLEKPLDFNKFTHMLNEIGDTIC